MRLNKYLSKCGVTSRRKADILIEEGRISINGEPVKEVGVTIDEDKDIVTFDGKKVAPEQKRYLILNKPKLFITSLSDIEDGKPTIKQFLSGIDVRVYPVGRLDYDSEGLLLLTNDGELANRIHHPSYEVKKLYFVVLSGKVPKAFDMELLEGKKLEDGFVKPDSVKILGKSEYNCTLNISFHEGKKHLVKRYLAAFDLKVLKLKRLIIGNIALGKLEKGKWRDLTKNELDGIKKLTGL